MHRMKFLNGAALLVMLMILGACVARHGGTGLDGQALAERLTGSTWTAEAAGTASPQTLVFGADGEVSGNGGCNDYNGIYFVENGQLLLGHIASTMRLCGTPVDVREDAFFEFLEEVLTVGLEGDRLTLTPVSGDPRVFVAR